MFSNAYLRQIPLFLFLVLGTAAALAAAQEPPAQINVISENGGRSTIPVSTFDGKPMVSLRALVDLVGAELRPGAERGAVISANGSTTRLTDGHNFAMVAGRLVLLQSTTKLVSGEWFVPLDFMSKVLPELSTQSIRYRESDGSLILGDAFPRLSVNARREMAYTRVEVTTSQEVPIELARGGRRIELTIQAPYLLTEFRDEELRDGVVERIRLEKGDDGSYRLMVELGDRFHDLNAFPAEPPDHGIVLNLLRSRVPTRPTAVTPGGTETIEEDLRSVEERDPESPTDVETVELETPEGEAGVEPETINLPPSYGTSERDPLTNAERGPARLRIVTLDPGHGGGETGAIGRGGLVEKEVVLSVARRLRRLLQERMGIRVVLTRDGDRELPLDERAAIANSNKADLFVSIHADASPSRQARGSSVYFLSYPSSGDSSGVSMAQGRGATRSSGGGDLDFILWHMAQASHLNQSSTLAEIFQEELIEATGAEKVNRGIKQNTFRVLKGATMPAVLVEVGFISNPEEEELLRSQAYQEKLAEALYRGVLRFKEIYEYEPRAERATRGSH